MTPIILLTNHNDSLVKCCHLLNLHAYTVLLSFDNYEFYIYFVLPTQYNVIHCKTITNPLHKQIGEKIRKKNTNGKNRYSFSLITKVNECDYTRFTQSSIHAQLATSPDQANPGQIFWHKNPSTKILPGKTTQI